MFSTGAKQTNPASNVILYTTTRFNCELNVNLKVPILKFRLTFKSINTKTSETQPLTIL